MLSLQYQYTLLFYKMARQAIDLADSVRKSDMQVTTSAQSSRRRGTSHSRSIPKCRLSGQKPATSATIPFTIQYR